MASRRRGAATGGVGAEAEGATKEAEEEEGEGEGDTGDNGVEVEAADPPMAGKTGALVWIVE
jgi:hypothetical protein